MLLRHQQRHCPWQRHPCCSAGLQAHRRVLAPSFGPDFIHWRRCGESWPRAHRRALALIFGLDFIHWRGVPSAPPDFSCPNWRLPRRPILFGKFLFSLIDGSERPLTVSSRAPARRRDPVPERPAPPAPFCEKEQPPARPDARPRFSGPPPMDKVRPENQSGHTPVSLRARSKARRAPPRPRSSAPKAAGAFRKKTNSANRNRPAPWPPARPGKIRRRARHPSPMDKVWPEK